MASVRANQVAQQMLIREEDERRTPLGHSAKALTADLGRALSALQIYR
jgi:hypothetical protein